MAPPINPAIYTPTHQTIHPHIGGRVYTNFKSLNRIEIFWLVQILLNFLLILGVPPRVRVWWVYGDYVDNVVMIWGPQRQPGDHKVGSGWGKWCVRMMGWCGDDMGTMGMIWGWQGQCGDNVGTLETTNQ